MKDLFLEGVDALKLNLQEPAVDHFLLYFQELKKWNKKMNLIGPADEKTILETHFLDSLTLLPYFSKKGESHLLDIGTGAGFPGLVLHIARPTMSTTLVEPRLKRVAFLKHICRTVSPCKVKILTTRIEENDTSFTPAHGPFSDITSRAVSDIPTFLDLVIPLCHTGTRILCMKGAQADKELAIWQQTESSRFFNLQGIDQLYLPFSKALRKIIVFSRNSQFHA